MFSVDIDNAEIFPVIYLRNEEENTFAEIYTLGAILNKFCINNFNIIDGYTSIQDAKKNFSSFKSAKLSPFACRIKDGKYVFNNEEFKLHKFYLGREALHGLLYDAVFSAINSGSNDEAAFVTLLFNYNREDSGYPFAYSCIITYKLEKQNLLTIETTVANKSDEAIPVCDGWHPYFNLGEKTDALLLQINSSKMLEFDERLLPSGNIIPYTNFQLKEKLGQIVLDNCFLLNENGKVSCILENEKKGLQLIVKAENNYPYLQIFTPEHRNSIAIENLSAAPDAFNNKMGLVILDANKSAHFKTNYQVTFTHNGQ